MIKKQIHLISRRKFINTVMFTSAGVALTSACASTRWGIGCFTRPWSNFDYRVAFDSMAEVGYKFAGLMTSDEGMLITPETKPEIAAAIGEEAKLRDLKIASVYGRNFDVRQSIDEGVAGLERLIDNTAACGSPNLLLGGVSDYDIVDDYYKVIAECCDYAADRGVGISLKPHGGTNADGPECRMRIEYVGHWNFTLWYDPGNIYFYSNGELDPVDDVSEVDGLVTGMCVKDFRMPRNVNITPGTGMVDFHRVLTLLKKGGFTQGPLIVETLSPGDGSLDYINAEAKKARQFLEKLTN